MEHKVRQFKKKDFKRYSNSDIAWVAFRTLFEDELDFSINETTKDKFAQRVKFIYEMPFNKRKEFIEKWLNLPYIYKGGSLNNYEENIKTNN